MVCLDKLTGNPRYLKACPNLARGRKPFFLPPLFPRRPPDLRMNLTPVLQQNHLREKQLQFIRAHQTAFDVEPVFPLPLFEDWVVSVEGDCKIEASGKVEFDRLIASRFLLFFDKTAQPSHNLAQALDFFGQVERRVDVNIDYSPLQQFIEIPHCLNTATPISCGIDLRTNLPESSLKTHFRLDRLDGSVSSILNLIEFALSFCSLDNHSLDILNTFNKYIPKPKLIPQVGFDFYLDGSTEIELYLEITEDYFKQPQKQPQVQKALQQRFSTKVLAPLEKSHVFYIGLSQANANPVLYYNLKNKQDFSTYFSTNSTAGRVVSFYQQQTTLPHMWVAATEQEFEKNKIESIRLYYYI